MLQWLSSENLYYKCIQRPADLFNWFVVRFVRVMEKTYRKKEVRESMSAVSLFSQFPSEWRRHCLHVDRRCNLTSYTKLTYIHSLTKCTRSVALSLTGTVWPSTVLFHPIPQCLPPLQLACRGPTTPMQRRWNSLPGVVICSVRFWNGYRGSGLSLLKQSNKAAIVIRLLEN